ncbi:hypothetical protein [Telluribacter sp.]|jgi:ligand-binding sensor domain-containing protein|uniref:hypothetical protein n=1 Tax=Telluribacter sp. TaxID=1978767 RepID=UPI002E0D5565|nr:hypothetical protein [Telluribacter sp.]
MAYSFDIPFNEEAHSLISRAKSTIEGAQGSFSGDTQNGVFAVPAKVGTVEGNYAIQNNVLRVTITKKPFIAPNSMIEDALRRYLG